MHRVRAIIAQRTHRVVAKMRIGQIERAQPPGKAREMRNFGERRDAIVGQIELFERVQVLERTERERESV